MTTGLILGWTVTVEQTKLTTTLQLFLGAIFLMFSMFLCQKSQIK